MSNLFNGRVFVGNFTDSRCGNHSYSCWTVTQDYRIVVEGEADVFLHRRNYDHDIISEIMPVEGVDSEINWEDVTSTVREYYFNFRFPEGTEIQKNIFVYGEQLGSQKNEENAWLDAHCVYNRAVTRQLRNRFGDFEVSEAPANIRAGYQKGNVFVINNEHIVNVWSVYYAQTWGGASNFGWDYSIESLSEKKAAQKTFGQKVSRLQFVCNVPWNIAKMGASIKDEQSAALALQDVRAARGQTWSEIEWELTCGIGRRKAAIKELIGDEAYEVLGVNDFGQGRSQALADYLLTGK